MGVDLGPIAPRIQVTLDSLRGRTIIVDGNIELYQFLSILRLPNGSPLRDSKGRVTSHLHGVVFRTTRLICDYGIKPIFVFDGMPPSLKSQEIERRREARRRAEVEFDAAKRRGGIERAWSKAVMTARLTRDMIKETKVFLTLLGIPYVQAPSEGEAQAAAMVNAGLGWAVGGKDFDSLLFGAPRMVRYITISGKEFLPSKGTFKSLRPEIFKLTTLLETTPLTRPQLIDAAILIGTDYNAGVRGIGPKRAAMLIRKHGRLEDLPTHLVSQLPQDYEAIRDVFLNPDVDPNMHPKKRKHDEEALVSRDGGWQTLILRQALGVI